MIQCALICLFRSDLYIIVITNSLDTLRAILVPVVGNQVLLVEQTNLLALLI